MTVTSKATKIQRQQQFSVNVLMWERLRCDRAATIAPTTNTTAKTTTPKAAETMTTAIYLL